LLSITIDALPGNAVFDRTIDGMEKTPGSGQGKDFSTDYSSIILPTVAIYKNEVAIAGQAPQSDLYRTLEINWGGTPGPYFPQNKIYELFIADTDLVVLDSTPVPTPVASSLMLLGTGLMGLVGLKRKYFG
jgi:hypothetical protein